MQLVHRNYRQFINLIKSFIGLCVYFAIFTFDFFDADNVRIQSDFIRFNAIAPFTLTAVRFYADNAKREHQTTSSTQNVTAPSLPDREQVERFLFRVLALLWDVSVWVYINTKKLIDTHIIANDSVQWYWKRMHERMAKAKKEW